MNAIYENIPNSDILFLFSTLVAIPQVFLYAIRIAANLLSFIVIDLLNVLKVIESTLHAPMEYISIRACINSNAKNLILTSFLYKKRIITYPINNTNV